MNLYSKFVFWLNYAYIIIVFAISILPLLVSAQNCEKAKASYSTDLDQVTNLWLIQDGRNTVQYADSILNILEKNNTHKCEIGLWFLYYKSGGLELLDQYEIALENYYIIIKEARQKQLDSLEASTLISMARAYEFVGRSVDCLASLNLAKKIIDKHSLMAIGSRYCVRYASYHRIFGQKDSSMVYALEAVAQGKKYHVLRSQADGYLLLGILTNDVRKAIEYYASAARLYAQYGDNIGSAFMTMSISRKYQKLGLINESLAAADSSIIYINKVEFRNSYYYLLHASVYSVKNKIYFNKGQIDSAYHYLLLEKEYNDKGTLMVNDKKIEQNAVAFAIEKEKTTNQSIKRTLKFQAIGVILLSVLLFACIVLLIKNSKKRKLILQQNEVILQKNESLRENIEKQNTLLSEVHHRVKNNLQLVISLLTLYGNQDRFKKEKEIFENLSGKVRSISLMHEQLYSQEKFDSLDIGEYLKNIGKYYSHIKKEEHEIVFNYNLDKIYLNIETAFPIGIICTELIANSLKYAVFKSQPLKIDIKCIKSGLNDFILSYKDNGPGFSDQEGKSKKNTMGLNLINSMVRQLQAECRMFNENGASINIVFQEKKISAI